MNINDADDYAKAFSEWWTNQPDDALDVMKAEIVNRYYPDGWAGFVQDAEKDAIRHENHGVRP